jgi:hypothetical protein
MSVLFIHITKKRKAKISLFIFPLLSLNLNAKLQWL